MAMNRFYSKNIENAAVSLDTQCFRIYSNLSKESPLETQSFRVYSRIKEEVYRNAMMNPQASHPDRDIESRKDADEDNFDDNNPRPEHAGEKESKNVNDQPPLPTKETDNKYEYHNNEYYYQMVEHDSAREKKLHDVDHHHGTVDQDSRVERGNDECYQVTQLDKEPKLHDIGYRYEMDGYNSQSIHQENDECYQVIEPDKELKLKEPKPAYDEHQEHEKPYQVTEPEQEPKPHDVDYRHEVDEHESQLGHQEHEKPDQVTQHNGEPERYDQIYPRYEMDGKDNIIESLKNEEHHQVIKRDEESRNHDQDEHYETLERQEVGEHHQTEEHRDEEPARHETDYRYNTDNSYEGEMNHYDTDSRYEAAKPSGYTDKHPFSSEKHYEMEESDEPPLDISMMKPGERLRRAREQRKLSVQHVADRLYLDAGVINALEADNYDNLPPAIFIRGYLRNYARLMEISTESIIESYNLVGQAPTPSPSITPQFKPKKQASSRDLVFKMVTVVIVVILMFLMALAWRYYPNTNQEFQPAIDISENDADTSSLKAFHKAMDVNEIYTPAADETITNTPEPKVNTPTTAEPAASEPNPPTPEPTEAPAAPPADNSHALRIHFTDRAWMRVTDNNDKKLYEGIGSVGKVLALKGIPPFHLKVGNIEGIKVEYQGETNDIRVYPKQKGRNYFIVGGDE